MKRHKKRRVVVVYTYDWRDDDREGSLSGPNAHVYRCPFHRAQHVHHPDPLTDLRKDEQVIMRMFRKGKERR